MLTVQGLWNIMHQIFHVKCEMLHAGKDMPLTERVIVLWKYTIIENVIK